MKLKYETKAFHKRLKWIFSIMIRFFIYSRCKALTKEFL